MNPKIKEIYGRGDTHDKWESCMNMWFGIASNVYLRTGKTPDHWEFRPSPFLTKIRRGESPDWEIQQAKVPVKDLIHAGNVFNRYTEFLKRNNLDY